MATVFEDFSQFSLRSCTKKLGQHYNVTVDARHAKETIKSILQANLQEEGVLTASDGKSEVVPLWPGLTFEQQRELLLLQPDKEL